MHQNLAKFCCAIYTSSLGYFANLWNSVQNSSIVATIYDVCKALDAR